MGNKDLSPRGGRQKEPPMWWVQTNSIYSLLKTHLRATCKKPPATATCSEQTPSPVYLQEHREEGCPALCYLLLYPSTCPQEPDMDPHWSVLISAICCCFPVEHADMKYQRCAEGVPPRRSRDANTPRGVLLIAHSE